MNPTSRENAHLLRREILDEARREAEGILRQAETEAEASIAAATSEAATTRERLLREAQTEADRQRTCLLATVTVESNRRRQARIAQLLDGLRPAILQRLLDLAQSSETDLAVDLASAAIQAMPGSAFRIRVSRLPNPIPGLDSRIRARTGRDQLELHWSQDPTLPEPGVLVETSDGRHAWDNLLSARLDRLWSELRPRIAAATGLIPASPAIHPTHDPPPPSP